MIVYIDEQNNILNLSIFDNETPSPSHLYVNHFDGKISLKQGEVLIVLEIVVYQ